MPTQENSKHTLFSDKSDLYARARPSYPPEVFDFIASQAKSHDHALDCATGNGQAAIGLANHFNRVTACDVSAQQIENHKAHDRIDYVVSPAETTPFEDNSFDLVNVAQALHWFDFDRFWPEVARVLKQGGVFSSISYAWSEITPSVDAAIEKHVLDIVDPYWAPENQMCVNGYADVAFPFEKLTTPKIDIICSWSHRDCMDYLHTWSATRRCMDDKGTAFFDEASDAIAAVWGDPDELKRVMFPLTIVTGIID